MLNKNEYLTNRYAAMRVEVKILTFVLQKTAVFIHNEVHWKPSRQQPAKRWAQGA